MVAVVPQHKLWTRDECAVLESAGLIDPQRYELIDGELILKMSKNHPHMLAVMLLCDWLRSIFTAGFVVQEPSIDVRPEDNPSSEPEPDAIVLNRSFLSINRRPRPEELQLVAEVSGATLQFDLTAKARLYARARIPEYWVLDLTAHRIIVHRDPEHDSYRTIITMAASDYVATLAAPDSHIRVGDLF